jgi:hypothetical protein
MARAKSSNGRLEKALQNLLQTQAIFVQNQAAFLAQKAQTDTEIKELERINSERFGQIMAILREHSQILAEHTRMLADHNRILEALPDALRAKIGFKSPQKPAAAD